jgi:hypothetical protein
MDESQIWQNGQSILVDIAQQEGLPLGPNHLMQKLMGRRNEEILVYLALNSSATGNLDSLDNRILEINRRYINDIIEAAKTGDNDVLEEDAEAKARSTYGGILFLVIVFCTITICVAICVTVCLCRRRKFETPVTTLSSGSVVSGENVVYGQPVRVDPSNSDVQTGTAVTVAADVRKSKSLENGSKSSWTTKDHE